MSERTKFYCFLRVFYRFLVIFWHIIMTVGFNTFFPKQYPVVFKVQNISSARKSVRIFNMNIKYGETKDLMALPYVSEADIKHSLLKGVLNVKIRANEITVTESNIDLLQFEDSYKEFLRSAGITTGIDSATVTTTAYTALYVNAATGSDLNDGSSGSPFQTLDAALRLAAISTVQTRVYVAEGTYTTELLYQDVFKIPPCIIGTDWEYLSDPVTLASLSGRFSRNYTFSEVPGWTTNQWEGYSLVYVDGPSGYEPNFPRTIAQSGANSTHLFFPHILVLGAFPQAGDRFRVAKPAARIRLAMDDAFGVMTSLVGARTGRRRIDSYIRPVCARLENIVLEDTYEGPSEFAFTNSWRLDGVRIEKMHPYQMYVHLSEGTYTAGQNWGAREVAVGEDIDLTPQFATDRGWWEGWGMSVWCNGPLRPIVHALSIQGTLSIAGLGEFHAYSSDVQLFHFSAHRTRNAGFPHGVIGASGLSYLLARGECGFINSNVAETSIHAEYHSHYEITAGIVHQGNNAFARARTGATMTLYGEPVVTGSNMAVTANLHSYINLQGGTAWNSLGTCTAGIGPSISRPAGPWAVGESIWQQADTTSAETLLATLPGDGSSITRSV